MFFYYLFGLAQYIALMMNFLSELIHPVLEIKRQFRFDIRPQCYIECACVCIHCFSLVITLNL